MVVPRVAVVYENGVVPPNSFVGPDFLESGYYNFVLVRDIFLNIPPIRSDGVLEIILERIQLMDSPEHGCCVFGPKNKPIYFVGRECDTPDL